MEPAQKLQPAQTTPLEEIGSRESEHEHSSRSFVQRFAEACVDPVNLISTVLLAVYTYFFVQSLPRWFHPGWTTDDALQQLFPFHAVHNPGLFEGDLISEVMTGYLAPIHYWVTYIATALAGDPIMGSHWVMLVQLVVTAAFLFLAVRSKASVPAALFSVAWLLHTRAIVQRMTAGLPRGWAAPILAAFLYFALTKQHRGVLITLLIGCLLHPPATFIAAVTYGLYLSWGVLREKTRAAFLKPFLALVLLSPLYIGVTYSVVKRPESVGQMVSYEEAAQMPQFRYPDGRFNFVPHRPADWEIKTYGFQAFVARFYNPGRWVKQNIRWVVGAFLGVLLAVGWYRRKEVLPGPLLSFFFSIVVVYFLSRWLAFKLYVPNRHLQFPLAIFALVAFPIAVWCAFEVKQVGKGTLRQWRSLAALCALCGVIVLGSGSGFDGDANFNYSSTKRGNVFQWFEKYTPEDSLIAGHPTFLDGLMLFGKRRGFATTETYHPFYKGYLADIEERLKVSFEAHYARDLEELLAVTEPYGIDYVVFWRRQFYPEALKKADYFPPLDVLVERLTGRPYQEYAYRKLPAKVDPSVAPFMPFKDAQSAVVDIAALRRFLDEEKRRGA